LLEGFKESLEESQCQNQALEDSKSQLKAEIQKASDDERAKWEAARSHIESLRKETEELKAKSAIDAEIGASEISKLRNLLEELQRQFEDEQLKSETSQNRVASLEMQMEEFEKKGASNAESAALEKAGLRKSLEQVERQLDDERTRSEKEKPRAVTAEKAGNVLNMQVASLEEANSRAMEERDSLADTYKQQKEEETNLEKQLLGETVQTAKAKQREKKLKSDVKTLKSKAHSESTDLIHTTIEIAKHSSLGFPLGQALRSAGCVAKPTTFGFPLGHSVQAAIVQTL
jgi:hypothetical protein